MHRPLVYASLDHWSVLLRGGAGGGGMLILVLC